VLSVLTKGGTFEHHKLFPDAQGRFMLNGDRLQRECRSVQEVVDYLATTMDGTAVLLRIPEGDSFYGRTPADGSGSGADDFYGSVPEEEGDFYGGLERKPDWLKGAMARTDAEAALEADRTPGNFLVRESKARKGTYAISLVIDDGRVEHHSLRPEHGSYLLNETPLSSTCPSLETVIEHLQSHKESMSRTLRPTGPAPYRGVINPGYLSGRNSMSSESGYSDLPVNLDGPVAVDLPPARPPKMNPGYVDSADAPPRPPKLNESFRGGRSSMASTAILEDDTFDAPPRPPKIGSSFRGAPQGREEGADAPPRPPKLSSSFRGGTFA